MAAACFAVRLARMPDPDARQRGLLWLSAGHTVVFVAVLSQRFAIWGPGLADWVAVAALMTALLLSYFAVTGYGDLSGEPPWSRLITLFGEPVPRVVFFGGFPPTSTRSLRSEYEQQIREAASHEERNRLARDLHDSVKQQIFAVQTLAATVQARFEDDSIGAKEALEQIRQAAREAMTEMEVMLDQLRAAPLENVGLVEAMKGQCQALGFRTGAQVQFEVGKLPPNESMAPGAATGEELLDHLHEWKPQIVLQDLLLPGGLDGIETTRRVRDRAPTTRVIALTASLDEARMMAVLRAGASGYVRKDAEPETLLAAVRAVARGKTYIDPIRGPAIPPGSGTARRSHAPRA